METPGYGSQTAQGTFRIRSQTDPEKHYEVKETGNGLTCSCPDHESRNADCKHIHTALEMIKQKKRYANEPVKILERSKIPVCKHCDSGNIRKWGRERPRTAAPSGSSALTARKSSPRILGSKTGSSMNPRSREPCRCTLLE